MRLRVVSWNVHGCVGPDRRFDPWRTAAALFALAPDLALLQEVGDNRGIHPPIDQADILARALGAGSAVGITLRASQHGYGNVTLTRLELAETETFDLSVIGREPRVCLRAVVAAGALRLTTLNVHLGLGPGERRRQLAQLLPALYRAGEAGPAPVEPLVMGGDFNDFPPGPVSLTLRDRLIDVGARLPRSRTFPSFYPLLRLDRVYVSPRTRVRAARVDRSRLSSAASDHLPLVVDLELEPSGPPPPG